MLLTGTTGLEPIGGREQHGPHIFTGGIDDRHRRPPIRGGSVNEVQADPAYGRTNWRRFAIAVGVPAVIAGGLVAGLAHGAFAASLTVSGQAFKIKADKLVGDGFAQYSDAYTTVDGKPVAVAVSGIRHAKLYNLCQSVHPKGSPVSLTLHAGIDPKHPAEAANLLIGLTELRGNAVFSDIAIGVDASRLSEGGPRAKGAAGGFAQEASSVTITDLEQTAYSTQAGTFTLRGLNLRVDTAVRGGDPDECF
jgi:Family of unknown function (DUF6230)